MFKKDLLGKLKRIFGVSKTTFNAPDYEAPEQDCLFIEIESVRPRMTNKAGSQETAIVNGKLILFAQADRAPYGFFAKRIARADASDVRNLFFEREDSPPSSPARFQNLVELNVTFTFLYDAQYDPERGVMNVFALSQGGTN